MNCINHPQREAAGTCAECGRPFCRECLTQIGDRVYCADHLSILNRGAKRQEPLRTGAYRVLRAVLVVIAVLAALSIVIKVCAPEKEYRRLDYDDILRSPDVYDGEKAMIEGSVRAVLLPADGSGSGDIRLLVAEKANEEHVWLVTGPVSDDNASLIREGMDVVAYGSCSGVGTDPDLIGSGAFLPSIRFTDLKFSYADNS